MAARLKLSHTVAAWNPTRPAATSLLVGLWWARVGGSARCFIGRAHPAAGPHPLSGSRQSSPRHDPAFVIPAAARRPPGQFRALGPLLGTTLRPCGDTSRLAQSRRQHVATSALPALVDGALSLLSGAAKVYGALLLAIFFLQRKLLFIPPAQVADPRLQGGDPEVVRLPAGKGPEQLAAALFRPDAVDAPVFIYFHGNADQIGWGSACLGNYFKSIHGLGLFAIEYPGYGLARPGAPTEESIYQAAEAMLLHLERDLAIPRSQTVLFGQSIGCAVAVEMARRGFGGRLVLLAPFTSTVGIARTLYPFLTPALMLLPWLVRDKFDNKAKAASIKMPTLVVHGLEDSILPPSMGQDLAGSISGAELMLVPGMDHNDTFDRADVLTRIASFARGR